MRLIDADALLDEYTYLLNSSLIDTEMALFDLITNAPTVQREGWVSVDELQKVYDDMFKHKDIAISANSLFKLINHE